MEFLFKMFFVFKQKISYVLYSKLIASYYLFFIKDTFPTIYGTQDYFYFLNVDSWFFFINIFSSFFFLILLVLLFLYIFLFKQNFTLLPTLLVQLLLSSRNFIISTIRANCAFLLRYRAFFLFVFFIFMLFNELGLLPYTAPITVQVIFIISYALFFFSASMFFSIYSYKIFFFNFFIPEGAPKFLKVFLALIEIISYVIRPASMSIRLFANMTAGHILLFILIVFCWVSLIKFSFVLLFISYFIILGIYIMEICLCFLQAYVLTLLSSIYFSSIFYINSGKIKFSSESLELTCDI